MTYSFQNECNPPKKTHQWSIPTESKILILRGLRTRWMKGRLGPTGVIMRLLSLFIRSRRVTERNSRSKRRISWPNNITENTKEMSKLHTRTSSSSAPQSWTSQCLTWVTHTSGETSSLFRLSSIGRGEHKRISRTPWTTRPWGRTKWSTNHKRTWSSRARIRSLLNSRLRSWVAGISTMAGVLRMPNQSKTTREWKISASALKPDSKSRRMRGPSLTWMSSAHRPKMTQSSLTVKSPTTTVSQTKRACSLRNLRRGLESLDKPSIRPIKRNIWGKSTKTSLIAATMVAHSWVTATSAMTRFTWIPPLWVKSMMSRLLRDHSSLVLTQILSVFISGETCQTRRSMKSKLTKIVLILNRLRFVYGILRMHILRPIWIRRNLGRLLIRMPEE